MYSTGSCSHVYEIHTSMICTHICELFLHWFCFQVSLGQPVAPFIMRGVEASFFLGGMPSHPTNVKVTLSSAKYLIKSCT